MIKLCNIFLPSAKVKAIPADMGKIFEPIPVLDKVIEVDVAPTRTIVKTVFNIVCRVS